MFQNSHHGDAASDCDAPSNCIDRRRRPLECLPLADQCHDWRHLGGCRRFPKLVSARNRVCWFPPMPSRASTTFSPPASQILLPDTTSVSHGRWVGTCPETLDLPLQDHAAPDERLILPRAPSSEQEAHCCAPNTSALLIGTGPQPNASCAAPTVRNIMPSSAPSLVVASLFSPDRTRVSFLPLCFLEKCSLYCSPCCRERPSLLLHCLPSFLPFFMYQMRRLLMNGDRGRSTRSSPIALHTQMTPSSSHAR